jgi:thioredoxin reductase
MEKIVIIGTGCAGLTAAIYAARSNLSPLVLTGLMPGGLLTTTSIVENFPGFPDGIDGYELMTRMQKQAERFGARVKTLQALETADLSKRPFVLTVDGERLETVTATWVWRANSCSRKRASPFARPATARGSCFATSPSLSWAAAIPLARRRFT